MDNIRKCVKKFCYRYRRQDCYDDYFQEACLAAVRVANRYDTYKDNKFWSYAHYRIWGSMLDLLLTEVHITGHGWKIKKEKPLIREENIILDTLTYKDPDIDYLIDINRLSCNLNPHSRYIMREHFGNDRTLKEVGVDMDRTESSMSYVVKDACLTLKSLLSMKELT